MARFGFMCKLPSLLIQPCVPREIQTFSLFTFLLPTMEGEFNVFILAHLSSFCRVLHQSFVRLCGWLVVRKIFCTLTFTFQVFNLDVVQLNWYKDVVKHSNRKPSIRDLQY